MGFEDGEGGEAGGSGMIDVTRFWDAVGAGAGMSDQARQRSVFNWAVAAGWSVQEYREVDDRVFMELHPWMREPA